MHAVVSLGRGLGMKVTAEGVETAEQQLFLRAAGVHSMQGYRFGRPVTAAEITARLQSPDAFQPIDVPEALALARLTRLRRPRNPRLRSWPRDCIALARMRRWR